MIPLASWPSACVINGQERQVYSTCLFCAAVDILRYACCGPAVPLMRPDQKQTANIMILYSALCLNFPIKKLAINGQERQVYSTCLFCAAVDILRYACCGPAVQLMRPDQKQTVNIMILYSALCLNFPIKKLAITWEERMRCQSSHLFIQTQTRRCPSKCHHIRVLYVMTLCC